MQREVEVVGARAVDRAGERRVRRRGAPRRPRGARTRSRSTKPKVSRSASAERAGAGRAVRSRSACGIPMHAIDGEAARSTAPGAAVDGLERDPVRADAGRLRREDACRPRARTTARRLARSRPTSRLEPVAQRDPREPQALGLGVERGALRLPLGGELILEVVEEPIPAHPARLGQSSRLDHKLSTTVRFRFFL